LINANRLGRFLLVGLSTTALYFGVLWGAVEGAGMPVTPAATLACLLAITYNYLLHYRWTFASEAPHGIVLTRYLLMNLGSLVINAGVMYFGVPLLGIHYLLVQLLAAALLVSWTLLMSALWVYRS
jgi:putative flippase GtrA